MSDQLPSWLSIAVTALSVIVTILPLFKRVSRRRRRRVMRFRQLKAWGIVWTRFDVRDDSQL